MTQLFRSLVLVLTLLSPSFAIAQQELNPAQLNVEARVPSYGPRMIEAYGSLWFLYDFSTLIRVDPVTAKIVAEIPLEGFVGTQREFVAAEGGLWIPDLGSNQTFKVDPRTNMVTLRIPVTHRSESIGVGAGAVWVGTRRDGQYYVSRFSAKSGALEAEIAAPSQAYDVAVAGKMVWFLGDERKLYRIDPATNELVGEPLEGYIFGMKAAGGKLYVPTREMEIHEIDPATLEVTARYATGLPEGGINFVFTEGDMWFTAFNTTLGQLDLATNTLERIYRGSDYGAALAFADGALWINNWSETLRITPP